MRSASGRGQHRKEPRARVQREREGDARAIALETPADHARGALRGPQERLRARHLAAHLRLHVARHHDVHADALRRQPSAKALAIRLHRRLAGTVGRRDRQPHVRRERAHERDLPRSPRAHRRQHRVHGRHRGEDVHLHEGAHVFPGLALAFGTDVRVQAGIHEDEIHGLRGAQLPKPCAQRVHVAQVELARDHACAFRLAGSRQREEPRRVPALQHQRDTRRRVFLRKRPADAAGGPGDQHGARLHSSSSSGERSASRQRAPCSITRSMPGRE